MRQSNHKIAAFTIAEMLVVLVLSGILIMLAMGVLNLVQKQIQLVEINYSQNNKVRSLERILWQDFNQYSFYYDNKKEQLVGFTPKDTLHYSFNDTFVIRNFDTIPVEIKQKSFFLNAEKVNKGLIDAIELKLSKSYQNTILFCYQKKDARFYLNNSN